VTNETLPGTGNENENNVVIHQVIGPKHSTEPPDVPKSFADSQIVESTGLDEIQDMSGQVVSTRTSCGKGKSR